MRLKDLRVQIFADGADLKSLLDLYHNPLIRGLTTNPTLMRKAGIADYERFAREVLETVPPNRFHLRSCRTTSRKCAARH